MKEKKKKNQWHFSGLFFMALFVAKFNEMLTTLCLY